MWCGDCDIDPRHLPWLGKLIYLPEKFHSSWQENSVGYYLIKGHMTSLPHHRWKYTVLRWAVEMPHVNFCFVDVVHPVLWLQQAQLFVKCGQPCSDSTFSPQLWAAFSDNSFTCAAALVTEPSHTHTHTKNTAKNMQQAFLWPTQHATNAVFLLSVSRQNNVLALLWPSSRGRVMSAAALL